MYGIVRVVLFMTIRGARTSFIANVLNVPWNVLRNILGNISEPKVTAQIVEVYASRSIDRRERCLTNDDGLKKRSVNVTFPPKSAITCATIRSRSDRIG